MFLNNLIVKECFLLISLPVSSVEDVHKYHESLGARKPDSGVGGSFEDLVSVGTFARPPSQETLFGSAEKSSAIGSSPYSKNDGKQSSIILKGLSADVDATNECIQKFIQDILGTELYLLNFQHDKKAVLIGFYSPRSKCSCFVSS